MCCEPVATKEEMEKFLATHGGSLCVFAEPFTMGSESFVVRCTHEMGGGVRKLPCQCRTDRYCKFYTI